ncbi:MAG: hypothetical protein ACYC0H_19750 [Solirubrobacteraceae bacterium]
MTPDELAQHKEIEYYASNVDAWFTTSLEHDRSVLGLSAGGIGLLLTLLTTVGLSSVWELVLYIVALACFVVALVAILFIFRRNRSYIEQVVAEKANKSDPVLSSADTIALLAFGLGVILAAIIGVGTAVKSYASKESLMAKEPKLTSQPVPLRESFNGVSNLRPSTTATKSFNGAANLAPKAPPASPTTTTPAAPPPAASSSQSGSASAPSGPATSQGSGGSGE